MNEPASLLSWLRLMGGSSASWAPFTLNLLCGDGHVLNMDTQVWSGHAECCTVINSHWQCLWTRPNLLLKTLCSFFVPWLYKASQWSKGTGCLWNLFSSFQLSSCMTLCTLSVPAGLRSCKCWCCSQCVSPCVQVSVLHVYCTCPPVLLAGTLSSSFVSSWQRAALSGWMWVQHRWYIIDSIGSPVLTLDTWARIRAGQMVYIRNIYLNAYLWS